MMSATLPHHSADHTAPLSHSTPSTAGVTVAGPFAAVPTVRHCDVGAHRLDDEQPWWLVANAGRGWYGNTGAACALHVPDTTAA